MNNNNKIKSNSSIRALLGGNRMPRPECFQMAFSRCLIATGFAFLLSVGTSFPAMGQSTNSSPRPDYSAFKIVTDRNIFNPHRYARSSRVRESRPTSKADSFALVGTMSYEKGTFAFFDGTSSEYKKAVKPSDTIASYTISRITPNSVELSSGTNQVELRVGMQMRRSDQDQWIPSGPPQTLAAAPSASSESGVSKPDSSTSEESEVLKRLRLRREQE